jgi:exonuclease III
MMKEKPFEVESQFTPSWEGRTWLNWGSSVDENRLREVGGFKFLSYNVFSDGKCTKIRYSSTKSWYHRKTKLLNEIKAYDADIICLQDVDHYGDWWQPQLMYIGYDSLYRQRTDEVEEHLEGVVIAYKRDLFQLFKTEEVLFNRAGEQDSALVRRRCRTDDVALMAFLQPWRPNYLESAVCIVSAMLSDHEPEDQVDVRFEHARYLTECIETENRSYHLPVIIGMSMYDTPDSAAYHVLRTGRSQLMPKAPRQVSQPIVEPFSRNSVYVKWKPPPTTEADPTILEYVVCWRPGGNLSIGYSLSKSTSAGDCIQYESTLGDDGLRRTVALEYRSLLIPNLSSETPFEFKVAAINRIGQGDWSRASEPFVLTNPPKASPKKPLKILRNFQEVKELCEGLQMQDDDWNTHVCS